MKLLAIIDFSIIAVEKTIDIAPPVNVELIDWETTEFRKSLLLFMTNVSGRQLK
jgi:hypothetical protein